MVKADIYHLLVTEESVAHKDIHTEAYIHICTIHTEDSNTYPLNTKICHLQKHNIDIFIKNTLSWS